MKKLLDLYDVCYVCVYKFKNVVFRKLFFKLKVCLFKFIFYEIDEVEINLQLGVVLKLKVIVGEYDFIFILKVVCIFLKRLLMVNLIVMINIFIEFGNNNLCYVLCVGNKEIWISGCDEFLRFYNFEGKFVKFIKIKLGNVLIVIVIIRFDDFIYVDNCDRLLNIVKGIEVYIIIRLQGW